MKSIYRRQFTMMAGMILISFALLGVAFISLSYRFLMTDRQEYLKKNATYISSFARDALGRGYGIGDSYFRDYIASAAMISDSFVILCTPEGEVAYASNKGEAADLVGTPLPNWLVAQVKSAETYGGMTALGGVFAENRFVSGQTIATEITRLTADGMQTERLIQGLVFVAADPSSLMELWRSFITIFFFTSVVVLLLAFVTSSFTTLHLTRPLHEMAAAAHKFAHGEFDVRVEEEPTRADEVGELAEAFNAMADSLAKAEQNRSEFIANVSHELKTPMTTIAGFADGILDGTIPPEREAEALRVISSETRRLSRLVKRLTDLSRLQSDERVAAQELFDVSEIVLRVLVSLENKINDKHLDVDAKIPDTSVMAWGDPDAITQVCYNLLDNAIKFSLPGSVLGVGITTKGGKALISVRNEGETIPPEELPLIFGRFHKTDRSRGVDREGMGLGLYIVKSILNTHKENITVTSEEGFTEFTFTLTLG